MPQRRAPSRPRPARKARSTTRLARMRARRGSTSRTGVALTIQIAAGRHPAASRRSRVKTRVSGGSPGASADRCAARADHAGPRHTRSPPRISLSVLNPSTRPARKTSVLTPLSFGLVARRDDGLLVRDGDVRAGEALRLPAHWTATTTWSLDVARLVAPSRGRAPAERRVLHPRRERVRDRVAEEGDPPGQCGP